MPTEQIWSLILWVHYLALSLWVGGLFFASAVMAPAVHRSMASKAVAGQIVSTGLKRLNTIELVACFLMISTVLLSSRFVITDRFLIYPLVTLLFMGSFTSFYAFCLTPKMTALRENTPGFDMLPAEDAAKKEFGFCHRIYVGFLTLNLILGLVMLYFSVLYLR